ncbi:hypothetical protein MKX01_029175 [Papaver californicum]|nr:hypothetical protein MKX01_029175 [Papaver californicum]
MSVGDQLGDDRSIDIKILFKLIVETQAKQAESHQQIIKMLRSTNSAAEEINDANYDDNQQAVEVVGEILKNNPEMAVEGITHDSSSVLHTAVSWKMDIMTVEEILKLISPDILEYKTDKYGYTACHRATMYGYAKAVVVMVNKNSKLTQIRDSCGSTPLELALQYPIVGQNEVVEYLYFATRDEDPSPLLDQDGVRLLHRAIYANFYGVFGVVSCQTLSEIGYREITKR